MITLMTFQYVQGGESGLRFKWGGVLRVCDAARLMWMNMLKALRGMRGGHEMEPLACQGQSVCSLPVARLRPFSLRMLRDKFRISAHPPSATTSFRPVSMGTVIRLLGIGK